MRVVYLRRRLVALTCVAVLVLGAASAASALRGGKGQDRWVESTGGEDRRAAGRDPAPAGPPTGEAEPTGSDRRPVPILMYHEVAVAPEGASYPELFVDPDDFAAQLRWLERRGYEPITTERMRAAWRGRASLPERPVVLSFDDGLRGQYDNALPLLTERGWPGVLNLKLEALEQGELSGAMVREMLAAGWELGSHTLTHADLTTLDGEALEREVAGSRRVLRRRFGVEVELFCYPAGSYDEEVVESVREAGYRLAITTERGIARPGGDPLTVPRLRIEGSDGRRGLADKLTAAGA